MGRTRSAQRLTCLALTVSSRMKGFLGRSCSPDWCKVLHCSALLGRLRVSHKSVMPSSCRAEQTYANNTLNRICSGSLQFLYYTITSTYHHLFLVLKLSVRLPTYALNTIVVRSADFTLICPTTPIMAEFIGQALSQLVQLRASTNIGSQLPHLFNFKTRHPVGLHCAPLGSMTKRFQLCRYSA